MTAGLRSRSAALGRGKALMNSSVSAATWHRQSAGAGPKLAVLLSTQWRVRPPRKN
jgi:hypothetical protein